MTTQQTRQRISSMSESENVPMPSSKVLGGASGRSAAVPVLKQTAGGAVPRSFGAPLTNLPQQNAANGLKKRNADGAPLQQVYSNINRQPSSAISRPSSVSAAVRPVLSRPQSKTADLADHEMASMVQSALAAINVDEEMSVDSNAMVTMPSELRFTEPASDPQYVDDLIEEIMPRMKSAEQVRRVAATYMTRQDDINPRMREILVDWLIEVHQKFKLQTETLFLTINLVDRFLQQRRISRTKLQLVGCTAMLLASKYEEIYAPEVMDFVAISDKAYTKEQILQMEGIVLADLNFNLTTPSPLRFSERYIRIACGTQRTQMTESVEQLTRYLMESTLQHLAFLKYAPSQIACASLALAMHTVSNGKHCWGNAVAAESDYSLQDLESCINEIHALVTADGSKYQAVRRKFSHRKFGEVSRITITSPFA